MQYDAILLAIFIACLAILIPIASLHLVRNPTRSNEIRMHTATSVAMAVAAFLISGWPATVIAILGSITMHFLNAYLRGFE